MDFLVCVPLSLPLPLDWKHGNYLSSGESQHSLTQQLISKEYKITSQQTTQRRRKILEEVRNFFRPDNSAQ